MNYEYTPGRHYINTGKFIRNTPEAREWDKQIRLRDGKLCQKCKTMFWDNRIGRYKGLEIHHIIPLAKMIQALQISTTNYLQFKEQLFDITNGIVICFKCHVKEHTKEKHSNIDRLTKAVQEYDHYQDKIRSALAQAKAQQTTK